MKFDSNVAVFDNKLNRVFEAEYDAWGKQTVIKNEIGFDHGFTGHEMLPGFDLIHMDGRVYDPTIGRFLSPDRSAVGRLPKQELRAAAGELAELQSLLLLHKQPSEIY